MGDWVVTSRQGKPVDVQALWYHALCLLADWLAERGEDSTSIRELAERCFATLNRRFWDPARDSCLDVVDEPSGDDPALWPNPLLGARLSHPVLEQIRWQPKLSTVEGARMTPVELRSLAPTDPACVGTCACGLVRRDGASHPGTAWAWLIGPDVDVAQPVRATPGIRGRVWGAECATSPRWRRDRSARSSVATHRTRRLAALLRSGASPNCSGSGPGPWTLAPKSDG